MIKDGAERVRQVLGIDNSYIKDEEVELPEFLPQAELLIKGKYPELFEDDIVLPKEIAGAIENAIIYKTALLFVPSLARRFPKRQKGEHAEFEIDTRNIKSDLEDNLKDIYCFLDNYVNDMFFIMPIFKVTGGCACRKRR